MKKLKPVIQRDFKDCGVCAMSYIISYYDGYIRMDLLREDTCTDINGTTAYHIVKTFLKWGFDSIGVLEHDLNSIELNYPFIAHLNLDNNLQHFVVVTEFKNNYVYLMDPGVGYTKMSINDFNKVFTGNIILAKPRNNIIKMDKELTISKLFLKIFTMEKFLILKIVFTSILWSLLTILTSYYLKIGISFIDEDFKLIKYIILVFLIFTIFKIILDYIRESYKNHLSNLVDLHLYPAFLKHIFSIPLKTIKTRCEGEIMKRVEELAEIKNLFADIFISITLDLFLVGASIVILYMYNIKLFNILFISIWIYILYGFITSKIIYKKIVSNINYATNFQSVTLENILMLESINNLNIKNKILRKIERCLSQVLYDNYKFSKFLNISNLGKDFLLELCLFTINSYGFILIYRGNLSIVDLFTFNVLISYCLDPIKNMVNILPKYSYIKASFKKISEFISLEEESDESDNLDLKGDIVFKNVSYSYNHYENILDNINLEIKEGTHVLLEGISGSGKSTLCKLLYKINILEKGEILIGNKNIKDISINTIRENIVYISQNERLFTGTIKENILAYRECDDKLFQDICTICDIESIVKKKSLRYNSLIEVDSNNVSGGEKQRIILARGLLKKSNIIIIDEALSEVDANKECEIIKRIKDYFKDKTIIYVSHKNQSKLFKNRIFVGNV